MKKHSFMISLIIIAVMMLVPVWGQASDSFDISGDVFREEITINVSFDNFIGELVSLQVIPYDTNMDRMNDLSYAMSQMTYFNQPNLDSKGDLNITIPFSAQSGKYIVRVRPLTQKSDAISETFDYTSRADAAVLWNKLTQSPAEILPSLIDILNVTDELIVQMKDDAELHALISEYENIGSFTRANTEKLMQKIKADCQTIAIRHQTFNQIATADNVSELVAIVTNPEKASALGITDLVDRYTALRNTRLVDSAVMGKNYATSADFVDAFKAALSDAEKAEAENDDYNTPSRVNKGSSGGSASFGASIPVMSEPISASLPFSDVSSVPWANDAILALYNKGIINGKSSTSFAPNDYILREEFVKMIAVYLGLDTSSVVSAFSDVDAAAWYAPYVASATEAGFINGYSDTVFGVGDYITRQDVAVILDRISDIKSDNAAVEFSDADSVADYARESVAKLSSAGVINGSNGAFMPTKHSTRAETACMIYRLSELTKEGE